MSRITTCFNELKKQNKKALITFITAGDPHPAVTVPALHDMVAAGVDILELGIPFSDPMAEGPVIQAACERALVHGVTLTHVFGMVAEFRRDNQTTPIVLMGYLNPIEIMGYQHFAEQAAKSGVDGLIIVDLPVEEAADLDAQLKIHDMDLIYLIAPTSPPERITKIAQAARGFLYYVSFKGVTGANHLDTDAVAYKVMEIREYTDLPVAVGFGIRDEITAKAVAAVADGVVVGSALVQCLALAPSIDEGRARAKDLVSRIRRAM